jgi:hypothetical protein
MIAIGNLRLWGTSTMHIRKWFKIILIVLVIAMYLISCSSSETQSAFTPTQLKNFATLYLRSSYDSDSITKICNLSFINSNYAETLRNTLTSDYNNNGKLLTDTERSLVFESISQLVITTKIGYYGNAPDSIVYYAGSYDTEHPTRIMIIKTSEGKISDTQVISLSLTYSWGTS